MYENNKLLCSALFLFCIIASLFSPKTPEQVQAKSISVETKAKTGKVEEGLSEPRSQSGTSTVSNKEEGRKECNSVCKIDELKRIGIIPEIAESLVTNCKAVATDPKKCIIIGASIVVNESSGGKVCRKNNKFNCFGIMGKQTYKSYNDATLHFAGKFERWWKNAPDMTFFYSKSGTLPKSGYCTSETSTNTSVGCPAGLRNSSIIFNNLSNIF